MTCCLQSPVTPAYRQRGDLTPSSVHCEHPYSSAQTHTQTHTHIIKNKINICLKITVFKIYVFGDFYRFGH